MTKKRVTHILLPGWRVGNDGILRAEAKIKYPSGLRSSKSVVSVGENVVKGMGKVEKTILSTNSGLDWLGSMKLL